MEDKNRLEQGFDDPERQVIYANKPVTEIGKCIDSIDHRAFESATEENVVEAEQKEEDSDMVPMGTASLKDIVTNNVPAPTEEEIAVAMAANAGDVLAKAKQKLEQELHNAKDKNFADPVIKYLLKRIEESESLAADVCQDHKNWDKCFKYIYEQARKKIKGTSGCVRDDVVYEWAEDYFHIDDKALEERKEKEAAERAKKQKENAKKQKEDQKKRIDGMKKREAKREAKKTEKVDKVVSGKSATNESTKSKHKKNELDGQMDLFSLMGL